MVDLCSSQESIGLASDPSDPVTPKRGRIMLPELPRARPVPSKKGALKKQVVEKFKAKKKEGQSAKKKAVGSQKTKEKKKKTKACEVKTKKGASGKQKTASGAPEVICPLPSGGRSKIQSRRAMGV